MINAENMKKMFNISTSMKYPLSGFGGLEFWQKAQAQRPERNYPHQVQDGVDYCKESVEGYIEDIMTR